jgi:probable addiction module antidote protein
VAKKVKVIPFDAAQYLDTPEAQAEFLAAVLATGDAAYIARSLGVLARAKGMTQIARESGLTREALYKSLSGQGDPRLSTLLGVTKALGLDLTAKAHAD